MTDPRTTDEMIQFEFGTEEPPVVRTDKRTQYTFGPYRMVRKLGQGGMATVFLVEIRGAFDFRKLVALKIMHAQIMREAEQRKMFVNEVRLGGMLQHPNIVQMFDCGIEGAQPFCTMEFVDGWSLERILQRCTERTCPLPSSVVAEVLHAVCDGLHFAHTFVHDNAPLSLVHRDVKPANILIGRHGEVKVADFGIAKARSNIHHTQTGVARGTAMYMSPEQTLGRELDCRSDVFSVGSMLFFALTGTFAFGSDNPSDNPLENVLTTMQAVLQCQRTFAMKMLTERHPEFLDVFMRATEKRREERYASAELLGQDLFAIRTRLSGPTLREWLRDNTAMLDENGATANVSPDELSLFQVTTVTPHGAPVQIERIGTRRPVAKKTRAFVSRGRVKRVSPMKLITGFVYVGGIALAILGLVLSMTSSPSEVVETTQTPSDVGGGRRVAVEPPTEAPTPMATPAPLGDERPTPTPRPAAPTPRAAATPAPTPRPAAATYGTVTLTSRPFSQVKVDGTPVDQTPRLNERLRTGHHRIEFVCTVCGDEPRIEIHEVTIIEGENPKIHVTFSD